ncbi:MAG: DNA/RNA non-specific endonuclease [Anaerolineaceae bacterium]|nr:DNA/RNA non-specific endonuclease [Anaerolineaceae bacterium]
MKMVTSNPEVFKAYLNGGSEFAENLLKHEDEIIQAGKAIGADELIDIMEGGKATIKSADELAEAGAKVVASSADEVVGTGAKVVASSGDEVVGAGAKVAANSSDEVAEAGGRAFVYSGDEVAETGGRIAANSGGEVAESGGRLVTNSGDGVAEAGGSVLVNSGDEAADIITDGSHVVKDAKGKIVGLEPNVTYKTGEFDYIYKTDDMGRISKFETDNLQLTDREVRLAHNPDTPGKISGQDHAGHIAGDRFGGSPELDNLVSQLDNVNLSKYKVIENDWAKAIQEGKQVSVNVEIKYTADGLRPSEFLVEYTIDGKFAFQTIPN